MTRRVEINGHAVDIENVKNPHLKRILRRKDVLPNICSETKKNVGSGRFETDYGDHREKYHDQYHEHAQYIES